MEFTQQQIDKVRSMQKFSAIHCKTKEQAQVICELIKIAIWKDPEGSWFDLYPGKIGYVLDWWYSEVDRLKNNWYVIYMADEIVKIQKKWSKRKHIYEKTYTRDDGYVFTKDRVGERSIEEMITKEKELYAEARKIRSLLNAHRKLKF